MRWYDTCMEIKDARALPPLAQEDLRHRAVSAVYSGKKQVEVAETLGVTRQAVGRWVKAYREAGEGALKGKQRGRPKGGSLLPWQAGQIAKVVIDRCPEQLKLPFYLWTREAVAQLIERKFEVNLSVWTVGRYLARWGFTPQKPVRRAFEQNPETVRRWLEKEYPALRQRAKHEGATIHWGDEMGLRSDHAVGRSFSLRGQTPVVLGTGQRFGCNMISAITNQGHLSFRVFKGHFHTDVFLDFLRRLIRQTDRKVFLIVDGHPVHRSKKAGAWAERHADRLCLFFLPGYSPELNPDELLNQDVKRNAVGSRRARNQQTLVANTRSYLWSRQRRPHIVKNYFQGKHVRYAAMQSI